MVQSAIESAKKRSGLDHCEIIESTSESAHSIRFRTSGSWMEYCGETLKLLVETQVAPSCEIIKLIVTEDKISWTISSFYAYQSLRSGGIMPVIFFVLKTPDGVLNIRMIMDRKPPANFQVAYLKSKPSDTALLRVNSTLRTLVFGSRSSN